MAEILRSQRRAPRAAAKQLHAEVMAIARTHTDFERRRGAVLSHLNAAVRETRARFAEHLADRSWPGLRLAEELGKFQDALLSAVFGFALEQVQATEVRAAERVALVATGGYGRGLLAPYSDLDLLFLRSPEQTAWSDRVIECVLLMLWDLGLRVGHAARSVPQSIDAATNDMSVRSSLLEARFVCGDRRLAESLQAKFRAEFSGGRGRDFIDAKLAEREARHRRLGASRYLVEPNIKEGKGGLRDLQTLYWIGKYIFGVETAAEVAERAGFSPEEYAMFSDAESFLWDVRCHLHIVCGRAEERLSFDLQSAIASRLGYEDADQRRTVEGFMRDYFLVAKNVGDLTRIFCAALEDQHRKDRPIAARLLPGFLKPRDPQDPIYLENGRLDAGNDAFLKDAANLIRLFHVAGEKNVEIHPDALRAVSRSLALITDSLRTDPAANRMFLDILSSRTNPERCLRLLNEAGVLAAFVPEFSHAVAKMQFNMYHHYTVDEHLIRTVGQLASLERGELAAENPLATELIRRIASREALYCAAFLHDIGKGLGGSHSETGASTARALCQRWGMSADDTATVAWLVRNHLLMSDTAQRRDIADPATVQKFVAEVQSPERLRLLYVLTVADIRAVGPGVWNGWKGRLLDELYGAADSLISGAFQPSRSAGAAEAKAALAASLAEMSDDRRREAMGEYDDSYWNSFDANALERNARVRADAMSAREAFALHLEIREAPPVCEIVVCARDAIGLFFRIAHAIAAGGGSILDAKAFTSRDGIALDVFSVQEDPARPFADAKRLKNLRGAIARAIAGEKPDIRIAIRRPGFARTKAFDVRPCVRFDNEGSATATVLEVEGRDRPGLLSDIAAALVEMQLSVSSAIVATYGEKAVDVFYVRDLFGNKVVRPDQHARIEARLIEALERGT